MKKVLASLGFALFVATAPISFGLAPTAAIASEIVVVVNRVPITSYDIQRRVAFLKLQNRKGNLNEIAEQEMIDQALRFAEMDRLGIRIPDPAVVEAYARFAASNKLSVAQLDQIMTQSGITPKHFKMFISSQMGWAQALQARSRAPSERLSEQDVARRMLQEGTAKPSATEYMLQQVIFVVPANDRGNMANRKREAEAMRARFNGCAQTREFAKGLLDVTVRDLGRKLALELPSDWADQIKETKVGSATPVRETDRGIEFIGICSSREVSDDRVAQMVLQTQDLTDKEEDSLSKTYMGELRERASIKRR